MANPPRMSVRDRAFAVVKHFGMPGDIARQLSDEIEAALTEHAAAAVAADRLTRQSWVRPATSYEDLFPTTCDVETTAEPLRWTTTPTVNGWYWIVTDTERQYVVYYDLFTNTIRPPMPGIKVHRWAGPIPPPTDEETVP